MKKIVFSFLPLFLAGYAFFNSEADNKSNQIVEAKQLDGPYVLYRNDQVFTKYIIEENGVKSVKTDSVPLSQKSNLSFTVLTDEAGKTFNVKLKKELNNEKAEFNKVNKQFVISDIEGNFGALRKLLQANGIIDENFNWTFGDGHLVLTGDFVDRGDQQTEVLWLIYSLEEKANAAGGHVHFVLGNHEIMNLNGDIRYLHAKYNEGNSLMNEHHMTLYGENSEIGRWLRTKNVVEKIGNILYAHAGISQDINSLDLSAVKINKLARPFYPDTTYQYPNLETDILFGDLGPFWYRGYYHGKVKATQAQVDSTLSIYKVKHIATGHTVVADTISILYNGKVINTDVHHAKGHIEGLLIENGKYYRAKQTGEKFLIKE